MSDLVNLSEAKIILKFKKIETANLKLENKNLKLQRIILRTMADISGDCKYCAKNENCDKNSESYNLPAACWEWKLQDMLNEISERE